MLKAWTGEPFEYGGNEVMVTPKPLTQPHPTCSSGGRPGRQPGAQPDSASPWRRPPTSPNWRATTTSNARTGHEGMCIMPPGQFSTTYVAEDPDRAWAELGRYFLHEATVYAGWQTPDIHSAVHSHATTVDELRAEGIYEVLTPDECVARADDADEAGDRRPSPCIRWSAACPSRRAGSAYPSMSNRCCPGCRADGTAPRVAGFRGVRAAIPDDDPFDRLPGRRGEVPAGGVGHRDQRGLGPPGRDDRGSWPCPAGRPGGPWSSPIPVPRLRRASWKLQTAGSIEAYMPGVISWVAAHRRLLQRGIGDELAIADLGRVDVVARDDQHRDLAHVLGQVQDGSGDAGAGLVTQAGASRRASGTPGARPGPGSARQRGVVAPGRRRRPSASPARSRRWGRSRPDRMHSVTTSRDTGAVQIEPPPNGLGRGQQMVDLVQMVKRGHGTPPGDWLRDRDPVVGPGSMSTTLGVITKYRTNRLHIRTRGDHRSADGRPTGDRRPVTVVYPIH